MYGAPVDLSFKCLSSMTDALTEEPNQGLRPLKRNAEKKFCSRSLRLNNNIITDLSGFNNTVSAFLSEPSQLAWVDLSFNDISHIDPVLVELKELRVLYLHGNSICNLSEVDKLGALPFLHTLTLHGNTMENEGSNRGYVIAALPHLKKLDFSAVTRQERIMAQVWHRPGNRGKNTRKNQDD
ncbi:leucine-rich repeat-containing protein 51 [Salmo salar]|uniref:Leucine-rich repeat-containing protein 51 n=2 Tax=Salmo TaxID=8028 RepID=A0A1S3T2E5_SALSA|nr:leucine rich repeat containing 51 [Salmo salar]XP_029626396.1 leucine-rich repeat-containing protein 51-like [Salmo trutta]XP_029626397.1 leucine-rich repeat-containing protein 51-like [Salmo trutta]XP_045580751.1 leucine rich repeat containing 51 [Salmo salar]|eukprot:XP_014070760.1 PREDICTED: leucine-rich repeat-containing protein 51-like isoform X2 [Salmo salar]